MPESSAMDGSPRLL